MSTSLGVYRSQIAALLLHDDDDKANDDAGRLESILRTSPEALRAYLQHVELLAALRFAPGRVASPPDFWAVPVRPSSTIPRWNSPRWIAIAASLVLVMYFVGVLSILGIGRSGNPTQNVATQERPSFATQPLTPRAKVVAIHSGVFASRTEPIRVGEALQDQKLSLRSGVVELRFEDGAQVKLEGPCEFSAMSDRRGKLQAGKLIAFVPKHATGFSVETPGAEIVDLGTEFGLKIDESGDAEVTVFQGRVEARLLNAVAQAQAIKLSAGETAKLRRDGDKFTTATQPDADLVRLANPQAAPSSGTAARNELRVTATESFNYPENTPLKGMGDSEPVSGWASPWSPVAGGSPLVVVGNLPAGQTAPSQMVSDHGVDRRGAPSVNASRQLALTYRRGTVELAFSLRSGYPDSTSTGVYSGVILKSGNDFRLFIGDPRKRDTLSLFGQKSNADTGIKKNSGNGVYRLVTTIEHQPGEANNIATLQVYDSQGNRLGKAATITGREFDFNNVELVLDRSAIDEITVSSNAAPVLEPTTQPQGEQP